MSIINDSYAVGVDTRNLVLKTRGSLHVKVGDRYYEIDFRNLGAKEDKEKEEYILSIDNRNQIETLEYPGENKLIIGLDGSIFITKNKSFIDVTPKATVTNIESSINNQFITNSITSLDSVSIAGKIYNDNGYFFDLENGDLVVESLTVNNDISFPPNIIKNNCCRTYNETLEDGTIRVARKYQNYDFIEIIDVPEIMFVKSGVMIKVNADVELNLNVEGIYLNNCSFVSGGLYIVYIHNGEIIRTKLN